MTSYNEGLQSLVSLCASVSGWEALMADGANLLAERLRDGVPIAVAAENRWRGLAACAADLLCRRLDLPADGVDVCCGPACLLPKRACVLVLSPDVPGEELVSLVHRLAEEEGTALMLCGAEKGLAGNLAAWCADIPSMGADVVPLMIHLVDALALGVM